MPPRLGQNLFRVSVRLLLTIFGFQKLPPSSSNEWWEFLFWYQRSEEVMNWYRKHEMLLWGLAILAIMAILIGASTLVAHN